ncbi:MAG: DUF1919 domain-containing protein [Bacteroides sp.]|nr:DUF1919 domain-containing protein [Bacteroides sp.]
MISRIKSNRFIQAIKKSVLLMLRKPYLSKLRTYISEDSSIITNNCFGGRIPQDLNYPYNSPTAGLFICYPDYIIFLKNLQRVVNHRVVFRGGSKYPEIDEYLKTLPWKVPIGVIELDDKEIEIIFLHYHSEEEARDKWERRCKRINLDKLVIFGSDNDRCTKQDVFEFLKLPYSHKFFFSAHDFDIPDSDEYAFIKEMSKDKKINTYNKAHILYKYLVQLKYF